MELEAKKERLVDLIKKVKSLETLDKIEEMMKEGHLNNDLLPISF